MEYSKNKCSKILNRCSFSPNVTVSKSEMLSENLDLIIQKIVMSSQDRASWIDEFSDF